MPLPHHLTLMTLPLTALLSSAFFAIKASSWVAILQHQEI